MINQKLKSSLGLAVIVVFLFTPSKKAHSQLQHVGIKTGEVSNPVALIPKEWADVFSKLEPDPHPEKLTRNSHYWVSDEQRHDLFREAISNKGGIFIGLGTDQNYLMAAWSRPEILVPLDFDQMIVNMHYVFRVVFLNAGTPREFLEMWSKESEEETKALLIEAYADQAILKGVLKAFKVGRRHVYRRLRRVKRTYRRHKVPTYLDDENQYRYVVGLFQANRVFPVRGDLTADTTVKGVAKAAQKIGLPIRTLYLSNAEQYFKYTKGYRENMLSLPFDEQSVVIRTAGKRTKWSADGLYEYITQSGENFRAWMKSKRTYNVWTIVAARKVNKKTGGSKVTKLPQDEKEK